MSTCDCGTVTIPLGADSVWQDDIAHAEPLCLPMPVGCAMSESRAIEPYIRRDDISWWAGCRYVDRGLFDSYIRETPTITRLGAVWSARRLAQKARRLRDQGGIGIGTWTVGDPR